MQPTLDRQLLRNLGLVLLASALPASAGVLVVSEAGGAGVDFRSIRDAVDAAAEGDTILVRRGWYGYFEVDGKSLSIVADGNGVRLPGGYGIPIVIRNLSDTQAVLVRGLDVDIGVAVRDCQGSVWFDDLTVSGDVSCTGPLAVDAAHVESSPAVTFTRSSLRGLREREEWYSHPTSNGLNAIASTVRLFDCQVQGGWGQSGAFWSVGPAQPGGAGLRIEASTVTVVGSTIRGGEGGVTQFQICTAQHAVGGPGVDFVGDAGVLRSAASTAVGGVASLGPLCPGLTGPQGPVITGTGTIVPLPGFARQLSANSPVRGEETLTFELGGQPGEIPLVLVSLTHAPLDLLNGSLLVGLPPTDVFVLPPLPSTGEASLGFPVPNVGAAVESLHFYAQAAFLDPSPALWLGAGTTVVLLDKSFHWSPTPL